jgi:hypothetical protein
MPYGFALLVVAVMISGSPVLAQGAGGSGGSGAGAASGPSASGGGTNQSGAQGNQQTNQNQQANSNHQGTNGLANSAAQKATTGANTLPANQAPGAVSAPGVGVGHSANGVPIGQPGSGPGSPEHPL